MNNDLILKYLKKTSTSAETEQIEKWILASKKNTAVFNQMKTDYILGTFENTSKEISTDKAFKDFQLRYKYKDISLTRKYASKLAYAAMFLILLTSGYFLYFNEANENSFTIPDNAITLQLEDGTVKIIEEDGSSKVLDKSGKFVGQQRGSQLVYTKQVSTSVEEVIFNTLTVPYGKKFNLLLSDGTKVTLNSGSSLKYPVQFLEGAQREVFITGEAYLDVAKDLKESICR